MVKPKSSGKGPAENGVFRGQNSARRMRKIPILDQWVEVSILNGVTTTELFPSNEVLIEEGKQMDPPPELVYRRINFPAGVPGEYSWTKPDEQTKLYGGGCIQRMTVKTWLETIEREAATGARHIGPSGHPNVPRPKERGGCDCPACARNEYLLEELGYAS